MRISAWAAVVAASLVAISIHCTPADAQGAVINSNIQGTTAVDQTPFNFGGSNQNSASIEAAAPAPITQSGAAAISAGTTALGPVSETPAVPSPPPPPPPNTTPYLAGLSNVPNTSTQYPLINNLSAVASSAPVLAGNLPSFLAGPATKAAAQVQEVLGPAASTTIEGTVDTNLIGTPAVVAGPSAIAASAEGPAGASASSEGVQANLTVGGSDSQGAPGKAAAPAAAFAVAVLAAVAALIAM